ncbi:MAG: myo-inositol-1(or 4)-monophosphatase [Myxococcota bacterium]|jgi:myo-inositol-1(or 4)-monophosphatase
MLTVQQLQGVADVASVVARAAGTLIATSRPSRVEHKPGASGLASQIVTDVDRAAERLIIDHLPAEMDRFELGLLTEETSDDGSRFDADAFWCIDPLDGTLPYSRGLAGYSVSIALVSRAGEPLVGVVFDPIGDVLYRAVRGGGTSVVGSVLAPCAPKRLRVCFDASMADVDGYDRVLGSLDEIATDLGLLGLDVALGSAGAVLNACHVLGDPPGCYFKFPKAEAGGGSVWDFAATACLFAEAGAVVSDMSGQPLQLNPKASTFMNRCGVLFASSEALSRAMRRRFPLGTAQ